MKKEEKNFKIDIKETILRNIFWIIMFSSIYFFAFFGINHSSSLEDETLKVMYLIFTLFFTLKIIVWVGHPEIILREVRE